MYALFVSLRIKPEKRSLFLAGVEDDATASVRDEPGCLRFEVFQDRNDENHYHFVEVYRDEDAYQAHQKTPHFERWLAVRAEAVESAERVSTTPVFPQDPAHWEK